MGQAQQSGQLLEDMATQVPRSFHLRMLLVRSALPWQLNEDGQALALLRGATGKPVGMRQPAD